jgi:hypothetical protein
MLRFYLTTPWSLLCWLLRTFPLLLLSQLKDQLLHENFLDVGSCLFVCLFVCFTLRQGLTSSSWLETHVNLLPPSRYFSCSTSMWFPCQITSRNFYPFLKCLYLTKTLVPQRQDLTSPLSTLSSVPKTGFSIDWILFFFFFFFFKDLFIIICKYIVAVFRHTRRGSQILLRMVVSHHVVAGI